MAEIGVDRLVLVRHAMPHIVPAVASERWELGAEGRAAARALRPLIEQPAYLVASDEPKALQTLQELSGHPQVPTDPGFAEVRRPHVADGDTYRALARAYLDGAEHDGWEPHAQVAQRFAGAVARHATAATGSTLVIGTHGLAPTVWLAGLLRLHPSTAQFWQSLRFPDIIDVDLVGRTVTPRRTRFPPGRAS
jgi:broad specificity phosphatase PhoE